MNPIILAAVALVVALGGFIQYFRTIPRNKVPENPVALKFYSILGIVLAVSALYMGIPGSVGSVIAVIALSFFPLFMGSFILWILTQRKTPIGDIKVKVGDTLLPFTATTSDGAVFNSEELRGKRTLLKFYRGGWCPYCCAELVLFKDMSSDLSQYNVNVVALSNDTAEEAHTHKDRDDLNFTLLSDPELTVIQQYGVEHHKALGGHTKDVAFSIGGIPFATKLGFKSMSIPTSLLVDEHGVIQWVDQSEDYRLRASKEAVMGAVKSAFGVSN
jgi:peroxiredoxin